MEKCTPEEDRAFGDVIFFLAVTERKARTMFDGTTFVLPLDNRVLKRRRKKRNGAAAIAAAEEKRARKAAKLAKRM